MKITGSEIIIQSLKKNGIDTLSGIPGGANLPLYDALSRSGIRHILARHEQGAGFIAQGMARATGRTAVCLATSGPGATNLVTAIADAKCDSVPMVAITGQVSLPLLGTDAFQEVDTTGLRRPWRSTRSWLEPSTNSPASWTRPFAWPAGDGRALLWLTFQRTSRCRAFRRRRA